MKTIKVMIVAFFAFVLVSCGVDYNDDPNAIIAATQEIENGREVDDALATYEVSDEIVLKYWKEGEGSKASGDDFSPTPETIKTIEDNWRENQP